MDKNPVSYSYDSYLQSLPSWEKDENDLKTKNSKELTNKFEDSV